MASHRAPEGQTQKDILAELRRGSVTVKDLARRLGITRAAVRYHLEPLLYTGRAFSDGGRPALWSTRKRRRKA